MSISLTKRQAEGLAFIRRYMAENQGRAPSCEEIRIGMAMASKGTVVALLNNLEVRGHIRRLPHKTRAIEILGGAPALIEVGGLTDQALKALAASMAAEIRRRGL